MGVLWIYLLFLLWSESRTAPEEDSCEPIRPDHGAHPAVQERSSPFAIPTKKLAMWLFIIADAATFAACLLAYGFLRNGSLNWPTPFKFFPTVVNAMVMTFILVTSSLTMFMGVRAAKRATATALFAGP